MFWKSWKKKSEAEDFLDSADSKRLSQPGLRGHLLLWSIAALLFVFFLWASLAKIDEVTTGSGKIIPSSKVQVVQHYEGGIVKKIFVKEGESVKKGQILMEIDNTQFGSTFREGTLKAAALEARIARLEAEANNTDFKIDPEIEKKFPHLVANERQLYASDLAEITAKLKTYTEQVNQKEKEYEATQTKVKKLKRSLELITQEYKLTDSLFKEGAAAKVEVLRLERQVNETSGEYKEAELQVKQTESALNEAKSKLSEVEATLRSDAAEELAAAKAELAGQQATNLGLEDRAARTIIKSPVNGTVKVIYVNTVGGSVKPGMDLVEIVPSEDTLLVEAKILPSDVAFIHPGQKATVKLTAYDFLIYGGLPGKVEHISADTIKDTDTNQKERSFYIIRIRTDRNYLGEKNKPLPIIPGMTAEVDILTGKKSVLDYLLKPLLKSRQKALRER